jgi:hypothetical protein
MHLLFVHCATTTQFTVLFTSNDVDPTFEQRILIVEHFFAGKYFALWKQAIQDIVTFQVLMAVSMEIRA